MTENITAQPDTITTTPCIIAHEPARPATTGILCAGCYAGTARHLAGASAVAEWVAEQITPGIAAAETDVVSSGSAKSRPPIDLRAVHAADTLWATLANHAVEFAALYQEVAPPAPRHARYGYKDQLMALPAGLLPTQVRRAVAVQARWLADHLDRIVTPSTAAAAELVMYFVAEVRGAVTSAEIAFPQGIRPTFSDLPHPGGCGGRVATYPPLGPGQPAAVQCERCDEIIDDVEWQRQLVYAGAATTTSVGHRGAAIMRHLQRELANAAAA